MKTKQWITKLVVIVLLCFVSIVSFAQDPTDSLPGDPGQISVYTIQNMSFGAFAAGTTGGNVVISNTGVRSVSGTITAINIGLYFHSIFEIEGPVGTIVSILNGPSSTLSGSNGGSMSLTLNTSNPASPFSTTVAPPGRTSVSIGGTLAVGNTSGSPPGTYTGTFYVTFNQE